MDYGVLLTILKYGDCTSYTVMVRLERMLDYRRIRLERFYCTYVCSINQYVYYDVKSDLSAVLGGQRQGRGLAEGREDSPGDGSQARTPQPAADQGDEEQGPGSGLQGETAEKEPRECPESVRDGSHEPEDGSEDQGVSGG